MHLELSKKLGLPYLEDGNGLLVSKPLSGFLTSPLMPANIVSELDTAHVYFTGLHVSNNTEGDDKSLDRCASDPEVQAAVAKLTAGE